MGRASFRRSVAAVALLSASGQAVAALPVHADVCHDGVIDKQRLAIWALDQAGVSRNPERWAAANPDGVSRLSPAERVLVDEEFCASGSALADGSPKCTEADKTKLTEAWVLVRDVLDAARGNAAPFGNPYGVATPGAYFRNANVHLTCRTADDGTEVKPVLAQIPSPLKVEKVPLRLRGSTDGLQFPRTHSAFAGLEKATVTLKDDHEGKKETFKAVVVAAVAIPLGREMQLVPYVGFNVDSSKKDGQAKEFSSDVLRGGALLGYTVRTLGASHVLLARPELATNRQERSEVVSANFSYVPIVNGLVNDYAMFAPNGRNLVSIIPRFDLRLNVGDFIKQGSRTDAESRSFVRAGAQFGFSIVSDIKWLPVEFSVVDTYLVGISGRKNDLNHVKATLSLHFDEKKFFGVDLSYARGRREDLIPREDNWSIGFGAKF